MQPAQYAKSHRHDQTRNHAEQANVQIDLRIRPNDAIRTHPDRKALDSRPGDERQAQPQENGQQQTQAGYTADPVRLSCPDGLRHLGLGAHAQKIEYPQHAGQQRGCRTQAGGRSRAQPFHKRGVHQAGKRLDHQGGHDGQAQGRKGAMGMKDERMFVRRRHRCGHSAGFSAWERGRAAARWVTEEPQPEMSGTSGRSAASAS